MYKALHLHRACHSDVIDALVWVIITLFTGLLPIWVPLLLLKLVSQSTSIQALTQHGELALFSATILASCLYISTKEVKFLRRLMGSRTSQNTRHTPPTFPCQRMFVLLSFALAVVAALLISGVVLSSTPDSELELDVNLLFWLSIILACLALGLHFLVVLVDGAFSNRPDVAELFDDSKKDLDKDFDTLQRSMQ